MILRLKEFQEQGPLEKGLSFKQNATRNLVDTQCLQGTVPLLETHRSLVESHQKIGREEAVETDFKRDQTTKYKNILFSYWTNH